ncbi:hypothetical protein LTR08_000581 [Meristemomyces frigidus]|nr:hypothetical protein LTR08_000581 [Meristemomyces frigidus]
MVSRYLHQFLSWILRPPTGYDIWLHPASKKMIVPDLTGLSSATALLSTLESSPTTTPSSTNLAEITKSLRKFGRVSALLQASTGVPRTPQVANNRTLKGLQDRQSCSSGTVFYSCANGFTGCCSVDPCNPGGGCPDVTTSSTHAVSSATSTHSGTATTHSTTASSKTLTSTAGGTSTTTSIDSASATSTGSATVSALVATPAPACPGGNGTTFTDSSNIAYVIHCNADNSYSSDDTITVGTGGYSECFSACSLSTACAGFTYSGLDSGSCYLKQQMPTASFVAKAGSNYISCSKVNATAAASSATSPSSSAATSAGAAAKKSNTGAIAGGVVGGLAFLALLLLLIALLARHRRKKIEERRATVLHISHGPLEPQEMANAKHARSGSTAHDAFAPFGGSYYPPTHTRQRSIYQGHNEPGVQQWADRQMRNERNAADELRPWSPGDGAPPAFVSPGLRAEGGGVMLPASVYKLRSKPSADKVAMLDSTPIKRPLSQSSGSRSPRFTEHLSEMEDTSRPSTSNGPPEQQTSPLTPNKDSPTLGRGSGVSGISLADETRRKQHLLSFNNYEGSHVGPSGGDQGSTGATMKSPPAARSPDQVSPDLSNTPRESGFVVSPFGSLDLGTSHRS